MIVVPCLCHHRSLLRRDLRIRREIIILVPAKDLGWKKKVLQTRQNHLNSQAERSDSHILATPQGSVGDNVIILEMVTAISV